MKQSLSLKLGQQVTMTPQLQQAIRLLQLSSLDLHREIQEVLAENPMLELSEEETTQEEPDVGPTEASNESASTDENIASVNEHIDQPIPEDLPVDTDWDDIYQGIPGPTPVSESNDWDFEQTATSGETLQEHLLWQLNLTPMAPTDRAIATTIIDAIDSDGMLTLDLQALVASLNIGDATQQVDRADVAAVLARVQQFDPVGVAARDLSECLCLQLATLRDDIPWRERAIEVARNHLDLLAAKDFATLMRKTTLDESQLASVVALIQSMNPRPGAAISPAQTEYIVPDVIVTKVNGRWHVELNRDATPNLRINPIYARLVKRADNSADNAFLKENLQEARWFLKSLTNRNETLLKVATRIVEIQRGFLEYGEEAMKPLVLHDIAEAVDMHESTISRVTSRKYMHTPRGVFELKHFFSSRVSTNSGGEVSSTAIRALIKKLTAGENPRKPLSDSKIATILKEQNIQIARRTVAKYRESLAIPPSNERKRLV